MADNKKSKKKKRVKYRFGIVLLAALLIFGYSFYTYFNSTELEDVLNPDDSVSSSTDSEADASTSDNAASAQDGDTRTDDSSAETVNPVPESERAGDDYLNNCVFVGDSVAYGLASYNLVPTSNVLAGVSAGLSKIDTVTVDTQYGEVTVIDALTSMQPKTVYVMFSSSNAAYMNANEMYQYFSSFMKNVMSTCPDSDIYIISIPPVTSEKEASVTVQIKNSDIDTFNEKLLDYCDRNSLHYLDMNTYLKNDNGVLSTDDAENDGMHLKYSTYTKFIDYILTHIAY